MTRNKALISFLTCLLCVTQVLAFTGTKAQLKATLKSIFGGEGSGPLPDFNFASATEQKNYTAIKGSPMSRTEIPPPKDREMPKNRTETEIALSRALKQIRRGENVKILTKLSKKLVKFMNMQDKLKEKVDSVTEDCDWEELINEAYQGLLRRNRLNKRLRNKRASGNRYPRRMKKSRDLPNYHQASLTNIVRKDLPYQVQSSYCYSSGSEGASTDLKRLCSVCYKSIDFGEDVVPRYVTSIECDNESSDAENGSWCLLGDGACVQKVVYYTFSVWESDDKWSTEEHPLNTGCECECYNNTITSQTYLD